MHRCWWGELWVKTHDSEQIYCRLILPRLLWNFQINAPLYCTAALKEKNMFKNAWKQVFTENWHGFSNNSKILPELLSDSYRLSQCPGSKEITTHHFSGTPCIYSGLGGHGLSLFSLWGSICTYSADLCHFSFFFAQLSAPTSIDESCILMKVFY